MLQYVKLDTIKSISVIDKRPIRVQYAEPKPAKTNLFGRVVKEATESGFETVSFFDKYFATTLEGLVETMNKAPETQYILVGDDIYVKPYVSVSMSVSMSSGAGSYINQNFDSYELAVAAAQRLADLAKLVILFEK